MGLKLRVSNLGKWGQFFVFFLVGTFCQGCQGFIGFVVLFQNDSLQIVEAAEKCRS